MNGIGIKGKLNTSGRATGDGSNTPVVKYQLTTIVQSPSCAGMGLIIYRKRAWLRDCSKFEQEW